MGNTTEKKASGCPVMGGNINHTKADARSNSDWWPNQLNLKILHQNSEKSDPMGEEFDYSAEFNKLDLAKVKKDLFALMQDSQEWWPADYGHYGPFFIRMAWHSAGTYRIGDGRGGSASGTLRFAPLNSWPDNANLDKARRLLWPIKKKYGKKISWADLMILTGNCALESMGFETFGFAGGREDTWEPEGDVFWGPETEWLDDERYSGDRELMNPLGAVQMGLIYVNPEGPNGNPDPIAAAKDIRETFARMAMNDEETVALVAGGHTFGKCHGAAPDKHLGADPEGASLEEQGLGWSNNYNSGNGVDTITSGLEGAWTKEPAKWDNNYFENLFNYEWEQVKSPAGATQWTPKDSSARNLVPDAHDSSKKHAPMMLTTDIALREDPIYGPISKRFHENPNEFAAAFAKAWFKLTHRDMGPQSRYLGAEVPAEALLWQDPVPALDHKLPTEKQIADLKSSISECGLSNTQLVKTAWAAAANFRATDKRGGANGGRLRLSPQKEWTVNEPAELENILAKLEQVLISFNESLEAGTELSIADTIVLAGGVGIENAAKEAGHSVTVPFSPGRTDASAEETDIDGMAVLEPTFDGFRNYVDPRHSLPQEELLLERACLLGLTAPEMTVLIGGLRSLGANYSNSPLGVLTKSPGKLSNEFFANLLDMNTKWEKSEKCEHFYEGKDRRTGETKWTATGADLVFGSNSQLRALAEVYACDDSSEKFVRDFIATWVKVMNSDRFDIA